MSLRATDETSHRGYRAPSRAIRESTANPLAPLAGIVRGVLCFVNQAICSFVNRGSISSA